MGNVRTTISIPEALLKRIDALAQKTHTSRNHLFALAVEAYLWQVENEELFQAINAAYQYPPSAEEEALCEGMRAKQRQLVQGQW